jgi:hypothetical protein
VVRGVHLKSVGAVWVVPHPEVFLAAERWDSLQRYVKRDRRPVAVAFNVVKLGHWRLVADPTAAPAH